MNKALYYEGNFGLERETLRVDKYGRLAQTRHPFPESRYITRDFCENQVELITPVCGSVDEAVSVLGELDRQTREALAPMGEDIWLYSNPPHIETEDDIPIACFEGAMASKKNYRVALQWRYGKRLMLLSGVHFNFSFTDRWLEEMYGEQASSQEFRNSLYMRLYKQLMRSTWLLVLLTASSPYYDLSFDGDGKGGAQLSRYASIRNSERGYWNGFLPVLDHTDLDSFCVGIIEYIQKSILFSVSELYLPVRLKPGGVNTIENLAQNGVDHIELRMFDLVPEGQFGTEPRDLKFAHLLMLYLLSLPDFDFTESLQAAAVEDHKRAALREPPEELIERGKAVLADMKTYFAGDDYAQGLIAYEQEKLLNRPLKENYYYKR